MTIASPRLVYPFVAMLGIEMAIVVTAVSAARTAQTVSRLVDIFTLQDSLRWTGTIL